MGYLYLSIYYLVNGRRSSRESVDDIYRTFYIYLRYCQDGGHLDDVAMFLHVFL
jgi:hypothetical protein